MENTNTSTAYPDVFAELRSSVREAGLLKRVPIRGSIEMIAILVSLSLYLPQLLYGIQYF